MKCPRNKVKTERSSAGVGTAGKAREFVWDGTGQGGETARYTIMSGRAASDLRLKGLHLRILAHLGRFNKKRWVRISQVDLARRFGVVRESTNRAIKNLQDWGYVEKRDQAETGHSLCEYRVIIGAPGTNDIVDEAQGGECDPNLTPPSEPLGGECDPEGHTPETYTSQGYDAGDHTPPTAHIATRARVGQSGQLGQREGDGIKGVDAAASPSLSSGALPKTRKRAEATTQVVAPNWQPSQEQIAFVHAHCVPKQTGASLAEIIHRGVVRFRNRYAGKVLSAQQLHNAWQDWWAAEKLVSWRPRAIRQAKGNEAFPADAQSAAFHANLELLVTADKFQSWHLYQLRVQRIEDTKLTVSVPNAGLRHMIPKFFPQALEKAAQATFAVARVEIVVREPRPNTVEEFRVDPTPASPTPEAERTSEAAESRTIS